ncbi:hypothetical protein [Alteromonas oceanisediminis]|uniref:hypothetical protein n=1 Tax=Alteromonas oceanisediminis TaxID=2836180 RepID=UPI001BDB0056|nr:hypothetical protein [Alteromonas oceanisediminis]MBT0587309.1 hypothetical protein [Alteromonas oceanisediminis]
MKTLIIDDELYAHIAAQTQYIGENASDILRRLLLPESEQTIAATQATEAQHAQAVAQARQEAAQALSAQSDTAPTKYVVDKAQILACNTVVERFLVLLSGLASQTNDFSAVLAIKGKGRDYFANSKEQLLATGSSTNPKAIPETQFWVVTNNNTAKKAAILRQVADTLGYNEQEQESISQALFIQ